MTKEQTFLKTKKLSMLLNLALNDFELVREDPDYAIDMRIWHKEVKGKKQCVVCLVGSVLAKTFKFHRESIVNDYVGDLVKPKTYYKLKAIASIRDGELRNALLYIDLDEEVKAVEEINNINDDDDTLSFISGSDIILGEDYRDFSFYSTCDDFNKFIKFYRRIARKLKMVGL